MEPSFWQGRWDAQQIGFHEGKPNRFLERYADRLGGGSVLVPLCGKSADLDALAARRFEVMGIELIERAVLDYFGERGEVPTPERLDGAEIFSARGVTVVRGDALTCPLPRPTFDALFDRAALIALPREMRPRYAARTVELLRAGGRILLVTLEHDAPSGPPFDVSQGEVEELYAGSCTLEELTFEDVLSESANLVAKGATRVGERVYLLEKR